MNNSKIALLLGGMLLLSVATTGQTSTKPSKVATICPNRDQFYPLKSEGISYDDATKTINLAFTQLGYANKSNRTGPLIMGTTAAEFYHFKIFSFNQLLDSVGLIDEHYTSNGTTLANLNRETLQDDQMVTKPFTYIKNTYPQFFVSPKDSVISKWETTLLGVTRHRNSFSKELNAYDYEADCEHINLKNQFPANATNWANKYCIDEANKTLTTFLGKKLDEKWAERKHEIFLTFDTKGILVDSFSVNFPFPREFQTSLLVRSKNNPNMVLGKVFFFERMNMLFGGKKYNDPEHNNYEMVYVDKNGKLLLYKTFKVIKENNNLFIPYYAISDGKSISIIQSNSNDLLVRTFTMDGTEALKENAKSVVTEKRLYDSNIKTRGDGAFDTPGLTMSMSEKFEGLGHVVASNGDILIFGRTNVQIDDPNFKRNEANPFPEKVTQYRDFACIQLNQNNELVALYGAFLQNELNEQPITMNEANGKLIFSTIINKGAVSSFEPKLFATNSVINNEEWHYSNPNLFRPKFISIDPLAVKIISEEPKDPTFTLFETYKYSTIVPSQSVLYYYGYHLNQNTLKVQVEQFKF